MEYKWYIYTYIYIYTYTCIYIYIYTWKIMTNRLGNKSFQMRSNAFEGFQLKVPICFRRSSATVQRSSEKFLKVPTLFQNSLKKDQNSVKRIPTKFQQHFITLSKQFRKHYLKNQLSIFPQFHFDCSLMQAQN